MSVTAVRAAQPKPVSIRLVALASFAGTTIEWYDFFLYGTAAALVFNKVFFPTFAPLSGTLAAYGTYAVGFVARPLGGIVIGHFGDRIGRKSMLVLTLVLMAVEHAPPGARGFYGSWPQMGVPVGLLLSTAVFSFFTRLPQDQFLSWGWRVPFLLSIVLVGVGLYIRLSILETPAFARLKESRREVRQPVLEVLRHYPKQILLAAGARVAENGSFYIYSVFSLTYATQYAGFDRTVVLNAILIASACDAIAIPLYGALSDRVGRRPVYMFGAVMTALFAFPFFWLIGSGRTWGLVLAMLGSFVFSHAAMYAPQAAFLSELFGTRVRYSGASLGSQLASVVAGGLAPLIATALMAQYGPPAVALYVAGMAAVTIVSLMIATETLSAHIDSE